MKIAGDQVKSKAALKLCLFLLFASLDSGAFAQGLTIRLVTEIGSSPKVDNLNVGQKTTFIVQILNYGKNRINSGVVEIHFNAAHVEVTDENGTPVTQLTPTNFEFPFSQFNKVDNITGLILFGAGTLGPEKGDPLGTPVEFVKITFKARARGETKLTFDRGATSILILTPEGFFDEPPLTFDDQNTKIGVEVFVQGSISGRPLNPFKCLQSVTPDEKDTNCFNIIRSIIPGTTFAITVKIYTLTGRPVKTLFGGFVTSDGKSIQIQWDGTDMYGRVVLNGVYVYQATLHTITGDVRQKPKFIAVMK